MGYIDYSLFDTNFSLRNLIETCIKIDIYDEATDSFRSTITGGITGGNIGISGESDVRWTLSLNVIPNDDFDIKIKENNFIWVDKYIKVYIGVYSPTRINADNIQYYQMGKYFPLNNSITYDPTNNQLSINCSDPVVNYNSTRNGQYGALNTVFPAYYDTYWFGDDTVYTPSSIEEEGVTITRSTYSVTIPNYKQDDGEHYKEVIDTGDIFCFKIPTSSNKDQTRIEIKTPNKSLGIYPVYQSVVGYELPPDTIPVTPDPVVKERYGCLFQMMYNPRTDTKYFTYLGECEQVNIIETVKTVGNKTVNTEVVYYITYHRIRDQIITVLKQLARLSEDDFVVDDVGEYKAMPGYPDYEEYREKTPLWDAVPFDQEFGVGSSIWQIITTFINLYPNYEAYFNYDGILHIGMKPDADNDPISIYNDYMKKIYISENTTLDLSVVRNVNLVYGKSVETDFYADSGVTFENNVYKATINGYDEGYFNGDKVALRIPVSNTGGFKIKINKFKNDTGIEVWDDNYEMSIGDALDKIEADYDAGRLTPAQYEAERHRLILEPDTIYVFKIKKKREDGVDKTTAYLLGHFQAAGLCALVSGDENEEQYTTFDGTKVPVYSEAYFKDVYNVETVAFTVNPDSPFTCEKIGVRLQVHSGGEFENIDSNSDAVERAKWETYKSARLTDSISLTTKLVPFINDVNFKVQYQPINEDLAHEYLVTSISHDFYGGQSSWTLMRFYAYYIPETAGEGTWDDDPEPSGGGAGTDYQTWDTANEYEWDYFNAFIWRNLYYKSSPSDYVIPSQDEDNPIDIPETVILSDSTYIEYDWIDLEDTSWRTFMRSSKW